MLSLLVLLLKVQIALAVDKVIRADGSSTVFPITEAMAEEFQKEKKGEVKVTVGISGTGGGFKKFCRGETDVQDASRPITTEELESCKKAGIRFIELPVGYDATVVVVNPKNTFLNQISVTDLKKMWEPSAQSTVTKWNQINSSWPNETFKLYGAGSDSGTFDYFTEAIVGKSKSSRGDYTASEDDNTLVTGISNDKNGLGYLPLAYYAENKGKLKALAIIGNNSKAGVLPSSKTVEDGTYTPLSRPIFIYVNVDSLKKNEVKEFITFYLKNAEKMVPEVKYVALPHKIYTLTVDRFDKNILGTVFGGHNEVGFKMDQLLKKEGKF